MCESICFRFPKKKIIGRISIIICIKKKVCIHSIGIQSSSTGVEVRVGTLVDVYTVGVRVSSVSNLKMNDMNAKKNLQCNH